jgi:hypothetical protein
MCQRCHGSYKCHTRYKCRQRLEAFIACCEEKLAAAVKSLRKVPLNWHLLGWRLRGWLHKRFRVRFHVRFAANSRCMKSHLPFADKSHIKSHTCNQPLREGAVTKNRLRSCQIDDYFIGRTFFFPWNHLRFINIKIQYCPVSFLLVNILLGPV